MPFSHEDHYLKPHFKPLPEIIGFDEAFFGTLRQISAVLAILGLFALRGWMSRHPIPYLVVFLSIYNAVMLLPFVGLYYGLHPRGNLWFRSAYHCYNRHHGRFSSGAGDYGPPCWPGLPEKRRLIRKRKVRN